MQRESTPDSVSICKVRSKAVIIKTGVSKMGGRGRGRGRGAVPPSVASAPFGVGSPSSTTSGIYNSRTEPSQKYPVTLTTHLSFFNCSH